jgi:transcriptional regulator with XRE-family HTH domain
MENLPKRGPIIKNRIRYCRTAINLRQKEVAFLMELPSSQISRWEKGKREPGVYNAIGLAITTGRLVEDIFFNYRQEWQEKIRERGKLLHKNENGKEDKYPNQGSSPRGLSK